MFKDIEEKVVLKNLHLSYVFRIQILQIIIKLWSFQTLFGCINNDYWFEEIVLRWNWVTWPTRTNGTICMDETGVLNVYCIHLCSSYFWLFLQAPGNKAELLPTRSMLLFYTLKKSCIIPVPLSFHSDLINL